MGRPFEAHDNKSSSTPLTEGESCSADDRNAFIEAATALLDSELTDKVGADLNRLLDFFLSHRKRAYVPQTEPAQEGNTRPDGARAGGLPLLRRGEQWPRGRREDGTPTVPLTFFLQLRLEDLPRGVHDFMSSSDANWPTEGLFQLFMDEELPGYDINNDDTYWHVRIIPLAELPECECAARLPDGVRRFEERTVTGYEEVWDFPSWEDYSLSAALQAGGQLAGCSISSDVAGEVLEALVEGSVLKTVSEDKLCGWPDWCQGPEWGIVENNTRCVQFLQVVGTLFDGFMVGDSGTLMLQRHPLEDAWRLGWACC